MPLLSARCRRGSPPSPSRCRGGPHHSRCGGGGGRKTLEILEFGGGHTPGPRTYFTIGMYGKVRQQVRFPGPLLSALLFIKAVCPSHHCITPLTPFPCPSYLLDPELMRGDRERASSEWEWNRQVRKSGIYSGSGKGFSFYHQLPRIGKINPFAGILIKKDYQLSKPPIRKKNPFASRGINFSPGTQENL